jgi:hypothetical protein
MSSTKSRGALAVVLAALAGIMVLALPAAASARDRNHDRIPDKWEKHYNLSLKVNQAHRNQDGDKLRNRQEFRAGTDPRDADTNDDGTEDGDNGGTIASFDSSTGTLVINEFDGSTLTGQVTDATEIQCEHGDGQPGDGGGDDKVTRHDGGSGGGDGDDDGGDQGDDGDPGDPGDGGGCTTADLVPGASVSEAELDDSGTVFEHIDLGTEGDCNE